MPDGPVLISGGLERQARLTFASYLPGDGYVGEFTVIVNADGLTANVPIISSPGGDGLPRFMRELVDDFRGWDGTRSWCSMEDQLRVEATWHNGGHVALRFHLTPSVYHKWSLSVEFTFEAGAELQSLADDLALFLNA